MGGATGACNTNRIITSHAPSRFEDGFDDCPITVGHRSPGEGGAIHLEVLERHPGIAPGLPNG